MPSISLFGSGSAQQKDTEISSTLVKRFPEISSDLQATLQRIVEDVVTGLGCVGAMVAPLEMNNTLPVRAYHLDIAPTLLRHLEKQIGISFIGPKSVSHLDNPKFKDNLSVRAVKGEQGRPRAVVSDDLHDLFRPVVAKSMSDLAQRLTGIKQVIAVPFFIGDEVVGNLFAASREPFTERDISFLKAFGNQAASAIQAQRYLAEMRALEKVTLSLQANITDETQVLQLIVDTVVHTLGYTGAMVATLESNDRLPVRAYAVGFDDTILRHLEEKLGVSFVGAKSVAFLDDQRFQENLSVRAVRGEDGRPQRFVVSDSLHDLFRPIVNKPLSDLAQHLTGIKQVMAVPFFLEEELVGNLFVATQKPQFSEREKEILAAFGQQAAVGLRNARLYRIAEERRQIAQMFARMAFSAAASIHALRNHVGAAQAFLQLVKMSEALPMEQRSEILSSASDVLARTKAAAHILDSLHEPWREGQDEPTDINQCLIRAVQKIFPHLSMPSDPVQVDSEEGVIVHFSLSPGLPTIKTSPDMLTEAFKVIAKNAVEAMGQKKSKPGNLRLASCLTPEAEIRITLSDDGIGIKPENLGKIFEMGWSTKNGEGMGFGLFWTKDYIEGLSGEIKVESIGQKQTTFTITLPVSETD